MVTGQESPDADGRFKNSGLHHGGLNDQGQVVFAAELAGSSQGFNNDTGIFVGDGTRLWIVAREGAAAPEDLGTFTAFTTAGGLPISNAGEVAFAARTQSGTGSSTSVYRGGILGTPALVARVGQPLPGGDGSYGGNFGVPIMTPGGQMAFVGSLDALASGQNGLGILWMDPQPGIVRFFPFTHDVTARFQASYQGVGPSVNSRGTAAFSSRITPLAGGNPSLGVAIAAADGLRVTGHFGEATLGGLGNFILSPLDEPVLNEAGQMVFSAEVEGLVSRYRGLYLWSPGAVVELASSSPLGTGGPWTFGGFASLDINDHGRVAFLNTDRNGDGGLFTSDGTPASLRRVVADGAAAPDGNGRLNLLQPDQTPVVLNEAGQVAFGASLTDTTGGGNDSAGIFLHDDRWGLLQVARTGAPLLGSVIWQLGFRDSRAGILGSVQGISESFAELNDAGEVAFAFALADGRTGIAIWSSADLANNRPPVSSGFTATVSQGQQLTLTPADLLAVTSDPEGGPVALVSVDEQTTQGVTFGSGFPAGNRTYRPPVGFLGVDEFSYVVRDELNFTTRVSGRITVVGVNTPPTAGSFIRYVRPGDSALLNASDILAAATDPDGDPLTLQTVPEVTQWGGAVTVQGDRIRVTPVLDRVSDQVVFEVSDGRGGTALVTVLFAEPNTLSLTSHDANGRTFSLSALRGTWRIERATALGGPWSPVTTVEIQPGGRECARGAICRGTVPFTDAASPDPSTYYRAIQ